MIKRSPRSAINVGAVRRSSLSDTRKLAAAVGLFGQNTARNRARLTVPSTAKYASSSKCSGGRWAVDNCATPKVLRYIGPAHRLVYGLHTS